MSRLIAAENIADSTRKSIGIHLIIFCPSSYFASNPHIEVDITMIHGNLIHINTGGSMKIKDFKAFERAQKASRIATSNGADEITKEMAWKFSMRSLRKAYGL